PRLTHRERALVTIAAIAPDVDGLGAIAELTTRNDAHPLLWYTDYHHVLAHNLPFAIAFSFATLLITRSKLTATLAFVAVHLHLAGDLIGSRGPDGYQWPIPYLYLFRGQPQLTWSGQWQLNAWPNVAISLALLACTFVLAWRRGYSIVGLISRRADAAFIAALRARF
ncbi:MAG TPA: metal-dependent hydrolase, partial [Thermoanaerobaculia bacterium]